MTTTHHPYYNTIMYATDANAALPPNPYHHHHQQQQLHHTPQPTPTQHPPRLAYFISRNNSTIVPLIPADELPFNIRLQGLPRVLAIDQTYGMQHVGMQPYTGQTFKLVDSENAASFIAQQPRGNTTGAHTHARSSSAAPATSGSKSHFMPPDALVRQALAHNTAAAGHDAAMPSRPATAHENPNWRSKQHASAATSTTSAEKAQSAIDAILSSATYRDTAAQYTQRPGPGSVNHAYGLGIVNANTIPTTATYTGRPPTPPSGTQPDAEKKEFCTYWIRTGECDYMQQGCLYKHEMPDLATLQRIGFRHEPRWYGEKVRAVVRAGMNEGGGGKEGGAGKVRLGMRLGEWLKGGEGKGKGGVGSGSDSESGSDGEGKGGDLRKMKLREVKGVESDDESEAGMKKKGKNDKDEKAKAKADEKAKTTEKKQKEDETKDTKKTAKKRATATTTTARHESPTDPSISEPRHSNTSDLIDFAPLGPSALTNLTAPSPAPSLTSASTSSREALNTPPSTPELNSSRTRVFVPRGESHERHLAAVKKREERGGSASAQRKQAPPRSSGEVEGLETQIQAWQKGKAASATSASAKGEGLLASKHAPKSAVAAAAKVDAGVQGEGGKENRKEVVGGAQNRSPKTGCRIRRPAGAAAAGVEGKAVVAKK